MRELFLQLVGVCKDISKQLQDASKDIQRLQAQLDVLEEKAQMQSQLDFLLQDASEDMQRLQAQLEVLVQEKAQMQSQLDFLLEAFGNSPSTAV